MMEISGWKTNINELYRLLKGLEESEKLQGVLKKMLIKLRDWLVMSLKISIEMNECNKRMNEWQNSTDILKHNKNCPNLLSVEK